MAVPITVDISAKLTFSVRIPALIRTVYSLSMSNDVDQVLSDVFAQGYESLDFDHLDTTI